MRWQPSAVHPEPWLHTSRCDTFWHIGVHRSLSGACRIRCGAVCKQAVQAACICELASSGLGMPAGHPHTLRAGRGLAELEPATSDSWSEA